MNINRHFFVVILLAFFGFSAGHQAYAYDPANVTADCLPFTNAEFEGGYYDVFNRLYGSPIGYVGTWYVCPLRNLYRNEKAFALEDATFFTFYGKNAIIYLYGSSIQTGTLVYKGSCHLGGLTSWCWIDFSGLSGGFGSTVGQIRVVVGDGVVSGSLLRGHFDGYHVRYD